MIEACELEQVSVLQEGLTRVLITTTGHMAKGSNLQIPRTESVVNTRTQWKENHHEFHKNQLNKSGNGR